ncbi:MAG: carbohydrate ABC transporter permease [Eubacterium sp.]|jgi:multiple sugar transport system permease protein
MNNRTIGDRLVPYLYISPIGAILLVFVAASVILSVVLSFTHYNILQPPTFAGLDNYTRLFQDSKFIKAFWNTLILMIIVIPLQMVVSLIVSAFLVDQRNTLLGKIANWAIFVPVLCSNAVVGVVWREMLNMHTGVIQSILGLFHADASMLLGNESTALVTLALIAVWKNIGYYSIIYYSGMLGISDTYYEAARMDGAGKLRYFFSITLPLLKPSLILTLFLSVAGSVQYYDLIANLTGGGPNNATTTLVVYAYSMCFGTGNAGYAMAIANVLLLIVILFSLLQRKLAGREASLI